MDYQPITVYELLCSKEVTDGDIWGLYDILLATDLPPSKAKQQIEELISYGLLKEGAAGWKLNLSEQALSSFWLNNHG